VRDLGLRNATDRDIFAAARTALAIIVSKDADFVSLIDQLAAPAQLLWVTCGNVSNDRLMEVFTKTFPLARAMIEAGEPIVEVSS
jgi:predicted nuclease of predicted toxin-antitoxin system